MKEPLFMRIRRRLVVSCVIVCLAGAALRADLVPRPASISLTAPSEVTVGRWVCPSLKIDIPLKVRWVNFDRIEFSYRSGTGANPSPMWESIGTFNKTTEQPTGDSINVSVEGTPAAGDQTALKVIVKYSKWSSRGRSASNQTLRKEFNTNVKFGCTRT